MMDRCDWIEKGWFIKPYPRRYEWIEKGLNDVEALETISRICGEIINTEKNKESYIYLDLGKRLFEKGLYDRVINTLYALLAGLMKTPRTARNLVYREYLPKELKYLEIILKPGETDNGLIIDSSVRIIKSDETRIKYISAYKDNTVREDLGDNIITDKIVLNNKYSGTAVFLYDTLSSDISISDELISLIVEGYGATYVEGIKSIYTELLGYPITVVRNVSSSITLLYSGIMPLIELNMKPINIGEINIEQFVKRIYETSLTYFSTGTIFSNLASGYTDLEGLCRNPRQVEKDTMKYLEQIGLSRDLEIALLELEADIFLGRAVIKIPEDSIIALTWRCYEGQEIIVDNKTLECSREGVLGKEDIVYPENKIAKSIAFIHLTYPAGGEIIIKRGSGG